MNPSSTGGTNPGGGQDFGCVALVCYVPDPQRSIIDAIRNTIPGKPLSPAHITVLPPRPLPFSIEQAVARIPQMIEASAAFEAELSEVRRFPDTDFLYLDIDLGSSRLLELHEHLNTEEFSHREVHEFRPHLTLGGPVPRELLEATEQRVAEKWGESGCPRRVLINELVCLWLAPGTGKHDWVRVGTYSLAERAARQTAAGAQARGQKY